MWSSDSSDDEYNGVEENVVGLDGLALVDAANTMILPEVQTTVLDKNVMDADFPLIDNTKLVHALKIKGVMEEGIYGSGIGDVRVENNVPSLQQDPDFGSGPGSDFSTPGGLLPNRPPSSHVFTHYLIQHFSGFQVYPS